MLGLRSDKCLDSCCDDLFESIGVKRWQTHSLTDNNLLCKYYVSLVRIVQSHVTMRAKKTPA